MAARSKDAASSSVLRTSMSHLAGTCLVLCALAYHGHYVSEHLSRHRVPRLLRRGSSFSLFSVRPSVLSQSSSRFAAPLDAGHDDPRVYDMPPLFIYRRTKKSGSSSMLAALLPQMTDLAYTPLYFHKGEMEWAVSSEFTRTQPRRLFIAEHNRVTRAHHPQRLAVIADTVRDGYAQMTSFCRYVRKVKKCTTDIADCLRSEEALNQIRYRWGDREAEDNETYIDLPLSSKHSALSTSVLRTVFPNITVDIAENYNRKFSTCPERSAIRAVYDELYAELDEQIDRLKKRMLIITGYPFKVDKYYNGSITLNEMLDAAERVERQKYPHLAVNAANKKKKKGRSGYSAVHLSLRGSTKHWFRNDQGKLDLKPRHTPPPSPLPEDDE